MNWQFSFNTLVLSPEWEMDIPFRIKHSRSECNLSIFLQFAFIFSIIWKNPNFRNIWSYHDKETPHLHTNENFASRIITTSSWDKIYPQQNSTERDWTQFLTRSVSREWVSVNSIRHKKLTHSAPVLLFCHLPNLTMSSAKLDSVVC
jgi:hypothetical protein